MDAKSAVDAVDGPPTKKLRAELSSNSDAPSLSASCGDTAPEGGGGERNSVLYQDPVAAIAKEYAGELRDASAPCVACL
eukprot:gene26280-14329_t